MIILFGSQKGGVGKSTLCSNLAVFLAKEKKDVLLLDCDSQATLSRWASDREGFEIQPPIECLKKSGNIAPTLEALKKKYRYILCDTAGRDSQELRTGLLRSDVFITPVRPSQADLDTLFHLEEMVEEATFINKKLKSFVVLTLASTNIGVKEEEEAKSFLKKFECFKVLETSLKDRKVFRDVLSDGKGVLEAKNSKASEELIKVAKEIF